MSIAPSSVPPPSFGLAPELPEGVERPPPPQSPIWKPWMAWAALVAAFGAALMGALIVGVPQAGSIAVVNFAAAYIPFLGAWSAGAFTVLIALGSQGTDAAIAMTVIVLLANGALQQMVQPIAMGAALGIHPLAVLVVTIASGALFGIVGMVVAAPLLSAAVKISADLAASRARAAEEAAAVSDRAEPGPVVPQPGQS